MKANLRPQWHHDAVVTCACGNTFQTGSTQATIQVDICNKCHPFFTGEQRFVDRQGRVEHFKQKMQAAEQKKAELKAKQQAKSKVKAIEPTEVASYQEILRAQRANLKTAKPVAAAA